ncbi:hypothetical protein [Nocardia sp. NPDC004750]
MLNCPACRCFGTRWMRWRPPAAPIPPLPRPCLWAALHGLVLLRQDRPSFPWPDLDVLLDTLVTAHLAAR